MEKKKPGCPAVTLLIRNPQEISVDIILALESKSSWPISTKEGLPIQAWLGTKVRTSLRREPFYLVPKNAKDGNGFQGLFNAQINGKGVKGSVVSYAETVKDEHRVCWHFESHQAKQTTT